MNTALSASIKRKQRDRLLRDVQVLRALTVPPKGWIAEVRGLLGIRAAQLAARLAMTQPSVTAFERAETNGTITLHSLEKVAAALGCRVVYAFVPEESFERLVERQAQLVAERIIQEVDHTMALEDQRAGSIEREEQIRELAAELIRTLPRELWASPA